MERTDKKWHLQIFFSLLEDFMEYKFLYYKNIFIHELFIFYIVI